MKARTKALATIAVFGILALAEFAITRALAPSGASLTESTGVAAIGGPFEMTDDLGRPVTQASLAGKPSVIYFGYTFCPEACPTTLADLTRWIGQLGPAANKMNFVFATVDPARDTVKVMHEYLGSFDPHIRGFTGTDAQVAKMAKAYKVYYKKAPTDGGGYLMDHTSLIYLMNADGSYADFIPYQEKDAVAVAKLKALAAKSGDV
jgi:protein SCO1/2